MAARFLITTSRRPLKDESSTVAVATETLMSWAKNVSEKTPGGVHPPPGAAPPRRSHRAVPGGRGARV